MRGKGEETMMKKGKVRQEDAKHSSQTIPQGNRNSLQTPVPMIRRITVNATYYNCET